MPFQLRYPGRGYGRRNPQISRSGRHAAELIDTDESADIVEVRHLLVFFDAVWSLQAIAEQSIRA